jgi:hypothetical protein
MALVVVATLVLVTGASFAFRVLAFYFPGDPHTCGGA